MLFRSSNTVSLRPDIFLPFTIFPSSRPQTLESEIYVSHRDTCGFFSGCTGSSSYISNPNHSYMSKEGKDRERGENTNATNVQVNNSCNDEIPDLPYGLTFFYPLLVNGYGKLGRFLILQRVLPSCISNKNHQRTVQGTFSSTLSDIRTFHYASHKL